MLSSIRIFFYRTLEFFRWIFGIVPKSSIGGSKVVFRIVHYTFWLLLILLCGIFSSYVRDPDALKSAGYGWFVQRYWLGIVVFLCYVLGKAVVYVLGLLKIEDRPEFEDIERCWRAGMEALERERMDFQWIPVFLVNGLTAQQEKSMFQAADLTWRVIAPPLEDTSAVLRFYGNDEQIFVSCTGVGAVNQQISRPLESGPAPTTSMAASGGASANPAGTLMSPGLGGGPGGAPLPTPGNTPLGTQVAPAGAAPGPARSAGGGTMLAPPGGQPPAPAPAAASGGGGVLGTIRSMGSMVAQRTMMPGAMARVAAGLGGGGANNTSQGSSGINPIDPEEIEYHSRRLEYLCDLINQERHPYCPINGMIQSAPLAWTEHDRAVNDLSPIVVHDLRRVHDCLGLQFPIAFLFTGLDKVAGLPGFIRMCGELDPRFRASRAGSRFPAGAEINETNCNWVVDRGLGWFRGWVYAAFARNLNQDDNKRLYHLLCNLQQRRDRLSTQLRLSLSGVRTSPNLRLSGCYFAATGEATNYQGFIKGLLLRLVNTQGEVRWHPEHIERDRSSRFWGYALLVLAAFMLAGNAVGLYWYNNRDTDGNDTEASQARVQVVQTESEA